MDRGWSVFSGLGLGAGLMYLFDLDRGKGRRALVRDKAARLWNVSQASLGKSSRDLQNRAHGLAAEARTRFTREDVSDDVLVQRVRARLGRVVSHPRSIVVTADQGRIRLSGAILAGEADRLLAAVASVRGVTQVENRLAISEAAETLPGMQGDSPREARFELLQRNWSPAARCLVGTAGGALAAYGLSRRTPAGAAIATLGAGMLARAATNLEMGRLVGTGGGRRAVDLQKTINIDAPVETVFAFWSNYENFPRWMTHVREVRANGDDRSHWVVDGPAGVPVGFDAVLTTFVPNEVIAWKSVPGAAIANSGIVRFEANRDGSTRVDIKFSYNPPAGAVGAAVASFFGADPKRMMDDDLARMKTLIETGNPPRDAAQASRTETAGGWESAPVAPADEADGGPSAPIFATMETGPASTLDTAPAPAPAEAVEVEEDETEMPLVSPDRGRE